MLDLDNIVASINTFLRTEVFKDRLYSGSNFVGITEMVPHETSEEGVIQTVPSVIDSKGESNPITLNDTYPLQVYHRLVARATGTPKIPGYGDENNNVKDAYQLAVVIIGDRTKIQEKQSQIDQLVYRMFPSSIKNGQGKIICYIKPLNTDFRTKTVFEGEFQGISFSQFYKYFIIKMDYSITTQNYQRQCVEVCNS